MKIDIEKLSSYLPSVEKLKRRLSFREKLKWILIILSVYFFLYHIPLIGILPIYQNPNPLVVLYSTLTGANIGSILTLGIAPIITASIIVQILVASKIINWDIREPEDRKKITAFKRLMIILFIFVEGFVFTLSLGNFFPIKEGFEGLIFLQIVLGGFISFLLADSLDKVGVGGINSIILAGIISSLFVNLFSPFSISKDGSYILWFQEENAYPIGKAISLFVAMQRNNFEMFAMSFISLVSTFLLILFTVYILRSVIEIPILHFQIRGFGRPLEFSLFYTSVLPIIFGSAILANLNLMFLASATTYIDEYRCGIFGCFDANNNPISGIAYYLSSPRNLIFEFIGFGNREKLFNEIIRLIIFFLFFTFILVVFSWIWTYTAGMDPESIAENLTYYGFGISGYRVDERIVKDVLNRYIPYLTILSGIFGALIATLADISGSVLVSTSLIILVSTSYNYLLMFKRERSEDIPIIIKKFLE
ncbi:MAG: hypothetical protein QW367_02260 [Candidatus Aenigmatarchaeota archaeon]